MDYRSLKIFLCNFSQSEILVSFGVIHFDLKLVTSFIIKVYLFVCHMLTKDINYMYVIAFFLFPGWSSNIWCISRCNTQITTHCSIEIKSKYIYKHYILW